MEQPVNVHGCKGCGAVCHYISTTMRFKTHTKIRTQKSAVRVDVKPRLIVPNKHGHDIGFTLGGRRIVGTFLQPGEKYTEAYEVYQAHNCDRRKDFNSTGGGR